MAEATKDPRAVELGRRGGLARRSRQTPEERKEIARLGGVARAAKDAERREQESLLPTNVTELVPVTYEVTPWKALRGVKTDNAQQYIDEHWTPRLIQFFEEQMQAYTKAGNLDAALNVAMTMAGMTSTLSPARLRKQAEKALDKYGAVEPDLSHLTDEQLSLLLGEPFSAPAATAPEPRVDQERGPDDLDDDRLAPFENIGVSDHRSAPSPDDRGVGSPVSFDTRVAPAARPQRTSKRDGRQSINARDTGPVGGPSAPSKLSCDDDSALNRILDSTRISYARRS